MEISFNGKLWNGKSDNESIKMWHFLFTSYNLVAACDLLISYAIDARCFESPPSRSP